MKVFLNGDYLNPEEAKISPFDRGYLFGESVYEVIPIYHKKAFRSHDHYLRLKNSLSNLNIPSPYNEQDWDNIINQLVADNPGEHQLVYIQISRGEMVERSHICPDNLKPTIFCTTQPLTIPSYKELSHGKKVITQDDSRWQNCYIKTTNLVANVMQLTQAKEQNAIETILIRDGYAVECTSSNFFIVKDNTLMTPALSPNILPGITRLVIIELAKENNIKFIEQPITTEDLKQADEIFICSTSKLLIPISQLDDNTVSNGKHGPVWEKLTKHFMNYIENYDK